MTETCYMCELKVTSREHVPPRCIFPEKKDIPKGLDFRKNLISVPSCDEHNSHKSLDDEYFMFVLSTAFQGNRHKKKHFETKVMRAVNRKPHVFTSFFKNYQPIYMQDKLGNRQESACYEVDLERFDSTVQHMACGIFYYHFKKKWLGGFMVLTNAFMEMQAENSPEINKTIQEINKQVSNAFSGEISLGGNEEIFVYKLLSDQQGRHAVHMVFYEGVEITVLLS